MDDMDLDDLEQGRSLLDQLLESSRLYETTAEYRELLNFTSRLRNFAPFNAMLLHVQKPGMLYAASACDWVVRFGRRPKLDARPLIILWPMGPVALVYDVHDTEGKDLPRDINCFYARGPIDDNRINDFKRRMESVWIQCREFEGGEGKAGSIRLERRAASRKERNLYRMQLNREHSAAVQFSTIAHELAHLFLGHLGAETIRNIPDRPWTDHAQKEIEAESVAYIVCRRNEVETRSQTYLAEYVKQDQGMCGIDIYQVMRATGQIETLLGLTSPTRFPERRG